MDGGDLGLSSTLWVAGEPQPAGGQATISMWINPASLSGDDRLFSQVGRTPCCSSEIGGPVRITAGGGLQVWPNDGTDWKTLATADRPENTIVANSWQHLAFVWNFGTVKSYLNGVPTGQFDEAPVFSNLSFDSAGLPAEDNRNFGLGARFHTPDDNFFGNGFDGIVDDLAIWDVALKADAVAMLAGGASPRNIDDSNPEEAFVFVPTPTPKPPAGKLVHYWPLNETVGTAATSGIPTGNPGTLVNFDEGKLNNAAQSPPGDWIQNDVPPQLKHSTGALDFQGQEGNVPDGNFLNGGDIALTSNGAGGGATVSLWLKPRSLPEGDGSRIIGQAGTATACCGHLTTPAGALRIMSDGSIDVWSGGAWNDLANADALVLGEWHHLAFVWAGSEVTAYVNGTPGLTAAANFNFDASVDANQVFGLGRIFNNAFGITPDGIFDDVSIWNGVLTADQIAALADGTSPLDIVTALPGDFNSDGAVDAADYVVWRNGAAGYGHRDSGPGASAQSLSATVPEPATFCLASLAFTFLLARQRNS
jgi:hypothetical protein